jgi:hypothetical protein
MKSFCNKCKIDTNQKVIAETEKPIHYDPDDDFIINCYQLIECEGCNTISYRTLTRDKISSELSEYTNENPWRVIDTCPKYKITIKKIDNIPLSLNNILEETLSAINSEKKQL